MHLTKTLYIPVEIIDRELGGALLMAAAAAPSGWSVVLGGKQALFNNMSRFSSSPGIFFLKSVVPGEVVKQEEILGYGHRVVSLDVEGLVPSNGDAGVKLRYSPTSIDKSDLLFFWGQEHFDSVRRVYPQISERARVTGSPIIDEIKVRGARYLEEGGRGFTKKILIGTSCGFANHLNGIEFSKEMTKNAYSENVSLDEIQQLEQEVQLDLEIFEYWKKVLPEIAKTFRSSDIVLRPHPSEDVEFWRSHMKAYRNVRIDAGQPILEELLGANVYIHFNSTSAIASRILGIPTLMPMPPLEAGQRSRVTYVSDISTLAETPHELIRLIREVINQKRSREISGDLGRFCENLRSNSTPAAQKIIEEIERAYSFVEWEPLLTRRGAGEGFLVFLRKSKYFLMWLLARLFSLVGYKAKRTLPPKNAYKAAEAKQPYTSLQKIKLVMSNLIDPSILGRLHVEEISNNLFIIRGQNIKYDDKA